MKINQSNPVSGYLIGIEKTQISLLAKFLFLHSYKGKHLYAYQKKCLTGSAAIDRTNV